MRQDADVRGGDRDVWVEEVAEADAPRLGSELEGVRVGVEGPGSPRLDDLEVRLAGPDEQSGVRPAGAITVGDVDDVGTDP